MSTLKHYYTRIFHLNLFEDPFVGCLRNDGYFCVVFDFPSGFPTYNGILKSGDILDIIKGETKVNRWEI